MVCEETGPRIFDIKCSCGAQFAAFWGVTQAEEIVKRHLRAADMASRVPAKDLDPATRRELLGIGA